MAGRKGQNSGENSGWLRRDPRPLGKRESECEKSKLGERKSKSRGEPATGSKKDPSTTEPNRIRGDGRKKVTQ